MRSERCGADELEPSQALSSDSARDKLAGASAQTRSTKRLAKANWPLGPARRARYIHGNQSVLAFAALAREQPLHPPRVQPLLPVLDRLGAFLRLAVRVVVEALLGDLVERLRTPAARPRVLAAQAVDQHLHLAPV